MNRDPALDCLDDPALELFGMLIETHNEAVHAMTARLVDGAAVPVPWIGVLIRLARSPERRLRMTELAHDMTMSASGLTRLVDRIEAAGLVRRDACPEDGRGLYAVLTPPGLDALRDLAPRHVADLGDLVAGGLDADQVGALTDLLRRVRDHLRTADRAAASTPA